MHRNDRHRAACAPTRASASPSSARRSRGCWATARIIPTSRRSTRAPRRSIPTSRSPPSIARSGCSRRPGSSSATSSATAARATRRRRTTHHDHLIDVETGKVIEFVDEELEDAPAAHRRQAWASAWSTIAWSSMASRPRPRSLTPPSSRLARVWPARRARPAGSCACVGAAPDRQARRGRSPWPRRFLARGGRICGAEVDDRGRAARARHSLLHRQPYQLARHPGPGRRDRLRASCPRPRSRGHPLLGWLADQNCDALRRPRRARATSTARPSAIARGARASAQPLAMFPEGTVGDGGTLLPFKPTPAVGGRAAARRASCVRPVAIDYRGAARRCRAGPGASRASTNVLRVLGPQGPAAGRRCGCSIRSAPSADRKALARAAHDAIAPTLAPSGVAAGCAIGPRR